MCMGRVRKQSRKHGRQQTPGESRDRINRETNCFPKRRVGEIGSRRPATWEKFAVPPEYIATTCFSHVRTLQERERRQDQCRKARQSRTFVFSRRRLRILSDQVRCSPPHIETHKDRSRRIRQRFCLGLRSARRMPRRPNSRHAPPGPALERLVLQEDPLLLFDPLGTHRRTIPKRCREGRANPIY